MANLTTEERTKIRRFMEQKANETAISVTWIKAAVNDASQAFEDLIDGTVVIADSEIPVAGKSFKILSKERMDAASTPHGVTFTNVQLKWIAAKTFELKFIRDRV